MFKKSNRLFKDIPHWLRSFKQYNNVHYMYHLVEIIQSLQGNYKYSQPYPPAFGRLCLHTIEILLLLICICFEASEIDINVFITAPVVKFNIFTAFRLTAITFSIPHLGQPVGCLLVLCPTIALYSLPHFVQIHIAL